MILRYQGNRSNRKTRLLKAEKLSLEEAAIYDLIFDGIPLRAIADRIGLSYQGVYIRALDYFKLWVTEGLVSFDEAHLKQLKKKNQE